MIQDIYDLENAAENACAMVVKSFSLNAFSSQDAPQFQKIRPRAEIFFQKGIGLSRFVVLDPATSLPWDGSAGSTPPSQAEMFYRRRESAWNCVIRFDLITEADITIHGKYRFQLRGILAVLWQMVNGVYLTNHKLEMEQDGGDSPILVAPDKGYFKTSMTFRGKISVQANAWSALIS